MQSEEVITGTKLTVKGHRFFWIVANFMAKVLDKVPSRFKQPGVGGGGYFLIRG